MSAESPMTLRADFFQAAAMIVAARIANKPPGEPPLDVAAAFEGAYRAVQMAVHRLEQVSDQPSAATSDIATAEPPGGCAA